MQTKIKRKLVIIESPFEGNVKRNIRYARACLRDSFLRGEYPFASHLLYTQPGILNDNIKAERILGIHAGLEWGRFADYVAVYIDLGISKGMRLGIKTARQRGKLIKYRRLKNNF